MIEPQAAPDATARPDAPEKPEDVVRGIVLKIKNEILGPGEVAELRRLKPEQPGGAAFWKIVVWDLEPAGQMVGADAEMRWALILRAIGELHELHKKRRLGAALAAAKVSEMRLVRLLRADLDSLSATLPAVIRQLASAGENADLADLAWLILTARAGGAGRAGEEAVRRNIARDYYRGLRKAAETSTSE